MSDHHLLSRYRLRATIQEINRHVGELLLEDDEADAPKHLSSLKPGDSRQLRGIPVVGGCPGAIPGTAPHNLRFDKPTIDQIEQRMR